MSAQIVDARGIFEARMVCVNAKRALNAEKTADNMIKKGFVTKLEIFLWERRKKK